MEGGPLLEEWWVKASKNVVPYLNVAARWEGAPDQDFLKKMGGRGFPYCTILNADGEVVWEARPTDEASFTEALGHAKTLADFKAALAKDPENKALQANVAIMDFMGRKQREKSRTIEELDELAKVEGVDAKVVAALDGIRKDEILMGALQAFRRDKGEKLLELIKKGTVPEEGHEMETSFWAMAADAAINAKDKALATQAIDKFVKSAKGKPFEARAKEHADQLREKVAGLGGDDK